MLIEALVGAFAFLAGVIAISRPTRDLHWAIKYTPIMLCSVGAFMGWRYASEIIPVVVDAKVSVMEVDKDRIYINVDPELGRHCTMRGVDIFFVDAQKNRTRVSATLVDPKNYLQDAKSNQWASSNVLSVPIDPLKYESFYVVTYDRCAFDVRVRSEFGHTLVPHKFNAGQPASVNSDKSPT